MNKIVIIPSAKLVPLELQNEFGLISTAMIPLDSRPALHYIAEYYQEREFNLLIAAHEKAEQIFDYCQDHAELNINVVDVGETYSIGETLMKAIQTLEESPDELVVNFADTTMTDDLAEGDTLCFSCQEDVFRWTTFNVEGQKISSVNEKATPKNTLTPQKVFVGVFKITDTTVFQSLLEANVSSPPRELDPFYGAIISYFNSLNPDRKTYQEVKNWHDFGHLDTYYETKKAISLNCRNFNQVSVDSRRGILRKTSINTQKFIDEIRWYLKLPVGLQYMAPRIFKYDLTFSKPYLEMEFYGYPALNDMYLFGNHDIGVWSQVFIALQKIIQDMMTYRLEPEAPGQLNESMVAMYELKTINRLEEIREDPSFEPFKKDILYLNDKEIFGLEKAIEILPTVLKNSGIYEQDHFSIIHGDLCLSNILYDQRNRLVRLIDPRGGFGSFDIYGDPKYDIAKLCHSLEGDYDFIANGLFDLYWVKEKLCLKVHIQERHKAIKELFHQKVLTLLGKDYKKIKLVESLLFLSMIPLHSDRPVSQAAFLARGLELFTDSARRYLPAENGNS